MRNTIRYAIRSLSRDRAFALIVVLSLAVGIGANTAIFSLINGVLLRPPAFPEPDRLVAVNLVVPKFAHLYPALPINIAMLAEWRKQTTAWQGIAAMRTSSFNLTGAGEPALVPGAVVTANMFQVLGVGAHLGRTFFDSEDVKGSDHVVLLSDSLWRSRFRADPAVVGRPVMLNGDPYKVIGVLPPTLHVPGTPQFDARIEKFEIFKPLGYSPDDLKLEFGELNYWVIARLRPGQTLGRAAAELNAVTARLSAQMQDVPDLHVKLDSLQDQIVGNSRRGLVILMAAVGAVLLVLCVNLANLSLARAAGRARDSAIRTALGAGRGRLLGQVMTESLLLAGLGGVLGIALAYAGIRALIAAAPVDLPRLDEVSVDWRVLLFGFVASLLSGLLFGVLPALRSAASISPYEVLKSGSHTNTEGRHGLRVRNVLIAFEVGLSAALLVVAGLLISSFWHLMTIPKGFDVERVVALDVSLPSAKYRKAADRTGFCDRLLEMSRHLPGVEAASLVSALPLQGETWIDIVWAEGDARPLLEKPSTNVRFISPDYFKTLHAPLEAGRDFSESDRNRKVVIISENLAQRLWPGQNAVGRKLTDGGDSLEVVGVTRDFRSTALDATPVHLLYEPYWQRSQLAASLMVRTGMDPTAIAASLRRVIWAVDADVPIPEIRTLAQVMNRSVARRRFQMTLVLLFAVAALLLAAFGTYGVISYAVERRRSEMGIRMALGAGKGRLIGMVLRSGMAPVVIGLLAGGMAALAAGRYVASLLFEVSPRDPLSFAAAGLVLLMVSMLSCLLPAWRISRVNPIEALRFE
jgi:predicted permease